jgi:hypothetical protein
MISILVHIREVPNKGPEFVIFVYVENAADRNMKVLMRDTGQQNTSLQIYSLFSSVPFLT